VVHSSSVDTPSEHSRPRHRFEFRAILALFFATGLAAYSVGPIPITWIATAGFIGMAIALLNARGSFPLLPGSAPLLALIFLGLAVGTLYWPLFSGEMPALSSLPYWIFVGLRYFNILAFVAAYHLIYREISREGFDNVLRATLLVGVAIAALALYIYVAQTVGLPQPPRTRLSTSGLGEQSTVFSSDRIGFYRRALGTFREPSHLAEWLILPLFASFAYRGSRRWLYRALVGIAFTLTVSMTGFVSAAVGFGIALLLSNPMRKRNSRLVGLVLVALLSVAVVLQLFAARFKGVDIVGIVLTRGSELLRGGLALSNRSYIIDFVEKNPPPLFGFGFGNGNILAGSEMSLGVVMSFLSLYLNTVYAAGLIGLALLLVFLFRPLWGRSARRARAVIAFSYIEAAYIAYLAAFAVNSEELTIPFAVTLALLLGERALANSLFAAAVPPIAHKTPRDAIP